MQESQQCCHGAARAPTHVWDPLNSKALHCWRSFGIIGAYLVFCFIGLGVRLGPHALIVTTRGNGNYSILGSLYIPRIPLLVGGGPTSIEGCKLGAQGGSLVDGGNLAPNPKP